MFSNLIRSKALVTRCVKISKIGNIRKTNFSSYDKKVINKMVDKLPKFQESNMHSNTGLYVGAGIAALGAIYFLRSDDETVKPLAGVAVGHTYDIPVDASEYSGEQLIRDRVKKTYAYVLGGLTITGASAVGMFKAGLPKVIMRTNPWLYLGISLATSIPLMIGTMVTDYDSNPVLKHALWTGFNVSMAGGLCTVGLLGGPLIAQAMLATGCVVGGLSLVASKAKPGSLEQYDGVMGVGLGVVVAAGLGSMIFPMPLLHSISLYGGLAVFSGLTMTDTQKLLRHAETSCVYDPIDESLGIYLDTLNIFIRVVQILSDLQNKKK